MNAADLTALDVVDISTEVTLPTSIEPYRTKKVATLVAGETVSLTYKGLVAGPMGSPIVVSSTECRTILCFLRHPTDGRCFFFGPSYNGDVAEAWDPANPPPPGLPDLYWSALFWNNGGGQEVNFLNHSGNYMTRGDELWTYTIGALDGNSSVSYALVGDKGSDKGLWVGTGDIPALTGFFTTPVDVCVGAIPRISIEAFKNSDWGFADIPTAILVNVTKGVTP